MGLSKSSISIRCCLFPPLAASKKPFAASLAFHQCALVRYTSRRRLPRNQCSNPRSPPSSSPASSCARATHPHAPVETPFVDPPACGYVLRAYRVNNVPPASAGYSPGISTEHRPTHTPSLAVSSYKYLGQLPLAAGYPTSDCVMRYALCVLQQALTRNPPSLGHVSKSTRTTRRYLIYP